MHSVFRTWMLPEGVTEALPDDAFKLNTLEQTALSTFSQWGYQMIRPPMLEYADTFISGYHDSNLAEETIQFKDQKSGKQLGFRADITPQIARIDAHYLRTDKVARYSYVGEVVRSYPTGHGGSRNPNLAGVEMFGSSGWQSDVEIVSLLIEYFTRLKLRNFVIELGNVDVVAELLRSFDIDEKYYFMFFDALSKKDNEKIIALCKQSKLSPSEESDLCALTDLYGDFETLEKASLRYKCYPAVIKALEDLLLISKQLQTHYPSIKFTFDLSDVHGYGYHNGLIFSAYVDGVWQAIANGGRYDGFWNDFGENSDMRPSIGFNCDLNILSRLVDLHPRKERVIAFHIAELTEAQRMSVQPFLSSLRSDGDIVINIFDDEIEPVKQCTHRIVWEHQTWEVHALTST